MARRAAAAAQKQLLTFRVAGAHYALPATDVVEVIRPPALTRVPLSPPGLSGLANLRGTVLPVVSLREILGAEAFDPPSNPRVVVVDRGTPIGLAVDEVTALGASATDMGESARGKEGSSRSPARLIDLDAVLARTFEEAARRARPSSRMRTAAASAGSVPRARDERALVSFSVNHQDYALPLDRVAEVIALPQDVSLVPRTDDAMLGVTAVRGQLLPLVSVASLLGLKGAAASTQARVVVAEVGGAAAGLVVDGMKDILRVPTDAIDPVPAVLTRGTGEAEIQAICRIDGGRRLVSILSPDRLLQNATSSGYLTGDHRKGAEMAAGSEGEATEQFVIFQIGSAEYGLPITAVDEIVRVPDTLTRLPSAPDFVEGVTNLRGRVIPVIDQRRRFDVEEHGTSRRRRIVVVTIDTMQAGFVVDAVSEVLRVPVSQLRAAPELAADSSRVIDRIANLEIEGRMILLLDARELLDRAERDLLASISKPGRLSS